MSLKAKYKGICLKCKMPINVGDEITIDKFKKASHVVCPAEMLSEEERRKAIRAAQNKAAAIFDKICIEGERPPEADPQGELVGLVVNYKGQVLREIGHGVDLQIDKRNGYIWALIGNGSDEDDPRQSNAPGSIAFRLPYSEDLAREIKIVDKIIPQDYR